MKILILGSTGLLGHYLCDVFSDMGSVFWSRSDCDVTNTQEVEKKIRILMPTVIINATAYTDVLGAESNKEDATALNVDAVDTLSSVAHSISALLVHYSTDYVFSGTQKRGYSENSSLVENPLNVYGATKLQGEKAIYKNTEQYYLIRTQWLFGMYGKDFIDTMLSLQNKETITVVNDQYGVPTYAYDVAVATKHLITELYPYGIYHIVNEGGGITWYDYACFLFDAYQRKTHSTVPSLIPTTTRKMDLEVKRPLCSLLKNTKYPPLPRWDTRVKEYIL